MKPIRKITLALALLALGVSVTVPAVARGRQTPQDDPFEKLKSYDSQSRTAVQAIYTMIQQAATKTQKTQIEQHLITVLEDPTATFAGKQEACRMLWIIGSVDSVPSLTKMLNDESMADIARYALERNVDPAAGKALRTALKTTSGKTQLGIINSLGDRGDAEAVVALVNDARDVIHASLTAVLAGIAVILALPGSTFATSRSFDLMARMMPEDKWAMLFWFVASLGLCGIITPSVKLRLASVMALSTMHGAFALCIVLANPVSTGALTYSILAAQGYYLVWRRTREGV